MVLFNSYLRYAYIGMDANFRLKNQLVSSYSTDPGLGVGMAYFVPRSQYEGYVLSQANDEDVSPFHLRASKPFSLCF